jgi:cytochrome oxidase assembly protein ShyY1
MGEENMNEDKDIESEDDYEELSDHSSEEETSDDEDEKIDKEQQQKNKESNTTGDPKLNAGTAETKKRKRKSIFTQKKERKRRCDVAASTKRTPATTPVRKDNSVVQGTTEEPIVKKINEKCTIQKKNNDKYKITLYSINILTYYILIECIGSIKIMSEGIFSFEKVSGQ